MFIYPIMIDTKEVFFYISLLPSSVNLQTGHHCNFSKTMALFVLVTPLFCLISPEPVQRLDSIAQRVVLLKTFHLPVAAVVNSISAKPRRLLFCWNLRASLSGIRNVIH